MVEHIVRKGEIACYNFSFSNNAMVVKKQEKVERKVADI